MNFGSRKVNKFIAVTYVLLLVVFMYFLPPVVSAILFLFLIVFSAVVWGLPGGLISAAWSSSIMAVCAFLLQRLSFQEFLLSSLAYFVIAVGVGKLSNSIKKNQLQLSRNVSFLKQSQEAAGIGSYLIDYSSNTWEGSEVMYDIFGIDKKPSQPLKEWISLIHPDWQNIMLTALNKTNEKNSQFNHEYKIIRKSDGEERWVYDVGKVMHDKKGNPAKLIGTVLDITEKKQKEEETLARNNELTALNTLSTHIRTANKTTELLPIVLNEVCGLLKAEDGMVMLLTKDKKHFTVSEAEGHWKGSIGKTFSVKQKVRDVLMQIERAPVFENRTLETLLLDRAINIDHMMFVPLTSDKELLGILAIFRPQEPDRQPFSDANLQLLSTIGEMVGVALHRQMLHESTLQHLEEVQALRSIDMAITGSLDIQFTSRVILDEIAKHLNSDAAAILRLDQHTGYLKYEDWRGFNVFNPESINFRLGEGHAGRSASKRKPIHIPNLQQVKRDPAYKQLIEKEGFASYYNAPLIVKGRTRGVLEIFHRVPVKHNKDWLSFLDILARQTAIAIDNADLFYSLEQSNTELLQAYDSTIEGWAYALDLKDEETEGHSRRVTEMTLRIAQKLEVKKEELAHIRRGALLHDIGKMGIPDSILLKPGKLTEQEWKIMKKHPEHAFRMLSPIAFLRLAIDIPYCHHEKWDGTGYPRGLKGTQIPLAARIFAVADVFDALTSNRPYRKAWSKEKALALVREQTGKHFDPQVVKVFIALIDQSSEVSPE